MELKDLSLNDIYDLHYRYDNQILNYKNALAAIQPDKGRQAELIKSRIVQLESEFEKIIHELKERNVSTSKYSREWIFQKSQIEDHTLIFELKPGSKSYEIYGSIIVGWGLYEDDEIEEFLQNITSTPPKNTDGRIKIKLATNNLPEDKIELLKEDGIETADIFKIQGSF